MEFWPIRIQYISGWREFGLKNLRVKFLKIFPGKSKGILSEGDQLTSYRQTGDIRLLGMLYEPYMEMVYAICYKYLKEVDESKDAVMQIFEKLINDLKVHEVDNFKSWLHSVTRNYCLMQIRARHTFIADDQIFSESGVAPIWEDESDQSMFLDERLTSLEKCLGTLIEEQKVSVEMFYKEERCYKEISLTTGFDLNKVKSYIQNGKRNLKICMEKNGGN